MTLFELKQSNDNWRVLIAKDARRVLRASDKVKVCKVCKYKNHVEACHIKPVRDFNSSVLVSVINDIDNLMYLCPNHHREFDAGEIIV